ncbi:MAG: hypothetical protein V1897_11160, partial [Pseudomonadota bacterium]
AASLREGIPTTISALVILWGLSSSNFIFYPCVIFSSASDILPNFSIKELAMKIRPWILEKFTPLSHCIDYKLKDK